MCMKAWSTRVKRLYYLGINIDMHCNGNELKNELCAVYDICNLIIEPICFKKRGEGTLIDPCLEQKQDSQYLSIYFVAFLITTILLVA